MNKHLLNKSFENRAHISVSRCKIHDIASFLTFKVPADRQIMYGEHFRFLTYEVPVSGGKDPKHKLCHVIDIIASNSETLRYTDNNVSVYPLFNRIGTYNHNGTAYREVPVDDDIKRYTVEYTAMCYYSQDLQDNTKQASNKEQFERIKAALAKVKFDINVGSYSDDVISFVSKTKGDVEFVHVLSDEIPESKEEDVMEDYLTYFHDKSVVRCVNRNNLDHQDSPYILYGIHVLQKYRYMSFTKFFNVQEKLFNMDAYSYQTPDQLYDIFHGIEKPLIYTVDGNYMPYVFPILTSEVYYKRADSYELEYTAEPTNDSYYVYSPFDVK